MLDRARRPGREQAEVAGRGPRFPLGRLEALRAGASVPPSPGSCREPREILVVASGSRNGSSLFADLLRQVPGLLHLPTEMTPFWHLAGLTRQEGQGDSDALEAEALTPGNRALLHRELSLQCGRPGSRVDPEQLALDLACRLSLQWTGLSFSLGQVRQALDRSLAELGWRDGAFGDVGTFYPVFLSRLGLDAALYDLPGQDPEAGPRVPPADLVVEEAPFVAVGPWRLAEPAELAGSPLVLKTASDAYRLDALRSLFPGARFRVLHLVRNAAASVNGLYDGWRHPGFWSHRVDQPLEIRGYTDVCGLPARWWWKFDLPPGWRDYAHEPLEAVCAFQWRSAHQAILAFRARHPEVPYHRVHFEGLVGPPARRAEVLQGLEDWLGVPVAAPLEALLGGQPRPVMATRPPRPARWRDRAELLLPVVQDRRTRDVMEALGYGDDPLGWL